MNRLKKFAIKKSNWVSIISFIVLLFAYIYGFSSERFSYIAIGGMFLFIAVENFVKHIVFYEAVNERLNALGILKPQGANHVELRTRYDSKGIRLIIDEAKRELFLSGINMNSLGGMEPLLLKRNDLRVRILVLNIDNPELLKTYEDMRGRQIHGSPTVFYFLRHFLNCQHIEIKMINSITPIMYIATDIDKPYGYIGAEHFTNNTDANYMPRIELTPANGEWYEKYRAQIETLWQRGEPWMPKVEEEQK